MTRVFKFARYSSSISMFTVAIGNSVSSLLTLLIIVSMAVLLFGSALYFAELQTLGERDDTCGDPCFRSILSACWSIIQTVTSVGYGDSHAITPFGRILASMCAIAGMLVLALPIAVFENNFTKVYQAREMCHAMIKDLTDHNPVPIDEAVLHVWLEHQVETGELERSEPSPSKTKDVPQEHSRVHVHHMRGNRLASAAQGRATNDPILTLSASALVAHYDRTRKGHLNEGEALLMLADINEFHSARDTIKMNAIIHDMAETVQKSMSGSLSKLEEKIVGEDYAAEMRGKQMDLREFSFAKKEDPKLPWYVRAWFHLRSITSRDVWTAPENDLRRASRLSQASGGSLHKQLFARRRSSAQVRHSESAEDETVVEAAERRDRSLIAAAELASSGKFSLSSSKSWKSPGGAE